ncbi:MAG: YgfZ/GcvT domain-containing protein [bacterium]
MDTVPESDSLADAYRALHESAIVADRSELGVLKFTGETRLDLINRMSTQAVAQLQSGEGAATVLTNDIGRMIDRLLLYTSSDNVYALTGENNAENVARYLMRFVFFQDDFHIDDLSEETAVLAVYGPQAAERLRPLFGDAVDLPLHHWRQLEVANTIAYLHRTDPIAGGGYFIMGDTGDKAALWQQLVDAGITPAGEQAFEYARIEAGLPRFGREITQDYIPLEAGLWEDVSFNKGCYTGQEIIARMESRGRLARKLVRLRASAPLAAGDDIEVDGRSAGTITSAAGGPRGVLALGYVKTRALGDGDGALTAGEATLELLA